MKINEFSMCVIARTVFNKITLKFGRSFCMSCTHSDVKNYRKYW